MSALHGAMTVRVRFHHRHDSHGRTDTLSDLIEVCGELIEIDLRPRRSTRNIRSQVRKRGHALVYLNSLTRFHVRHKLAPLSHSAPGLKTNEETYHPPTHYLSFLSQHPRLWTTRTSTRRRDCRQAFGQKPSGRQEGQRLARRAHACASGELSGWDQKLGRLQGICQQRSGY